MHTILGVWAVLLQCVVGQGSIEDFDHVNGDGAHTRMFYYFDKDRNNVLSPSELASYQVSEVHFNYYDRDSDGSLSYQEFILFWRERILYRSAKLDGPDPVGHMKPLGSHKQSLGSIDVITDPISPKEFWEK